MEISKMIADFFHRLFGQKSTEPDAPASEPQITVNPAPEASKAQTDVSPKDTIATEEARPAVSTPEPAKTEAPALSPAPAKLFEQLAAAFKGLIEKAKGGKPAIKISVIDGPCNFNDFLAWFKAKNLDPQEHTPFIMKITPETAKKLSIPDLSIPDFTKPVGIMLGIYCKSDDTIQFQAIQCDSLDQQTKDVLGNETIVLLS